jgi:hypothetical protein
MYLRGMASDLSEVPACMLLGHHGTQPCPVRCEAYKAYKAGLFMQYFLSQTACTSFLSASTLDCCYMQPCPDFAIEPNLLNGHLEALAMSPFLFTYLFKVM